MTGLQIVKTEDIRGEIITITDSMTVGKVFGKVHRQVLRDIDVIISDLEEVSTKLCIPLFWEVDHVNSQNKQKYRKYEMTRDGFSLLAMGFTGKKALEFKLKYIQEFNRMDNELNNYLPKIPDNEIYLKGKYDGAVEAFQKVIKGNAISQIGSLGTVKNTSLRDFNFIGKKYYTPTDIGLKLGLTAEKVNNILLENGIIKRVFPVDAFSDNATSYEITSSYQMLINDGFAIYVSNSRYGRQLRYSSKGANYIATVISGGIK
ncbi:Rha family transcriptional regulator [uncultured Vagococcus sp.]|uniref:Rha family transcriptional regulator n=1 Tax=uncultured Vagococcus sp. TaxID=189676 RepID=UPI00258A0219|nr:Rha family transcriptional regulator [uncultured Vagococcus sp.]